MWVFMPQRCEPFCLMTSIATWLKLNNPIRLLGFDGSTQGGGYVMFCYCNARPFSFCSLVWKECGDPYWGSPLFACVWSLSARASTEWLATNSRSRSWSSLSTVWSGMSIIVIAWPKCWCSGSLAMCGTYLSRGSLAIIFVLFVFVAPLRPFWMFYGRSCDVIRQVCIPGLVTSGWSPPWCLLTPEGSVFVLIRFVLNVETFGFWMESLFPVRWCELLKQLKFMRIARVPGIILSSARIVSPSKWG